MNIICLLFFKIYTRRKFKDADDASSNFAVKKKRILVKVEKIEKSYSVQEKMFLITLKTDYFQGQFR